MGPRVLSWEEFHGGIFEKKCIQFDSFFRGYWIGQKTSDDELMTSFENGKIYFIAIEEKLHLSGKKNLWKKIHGSLRTFLYEY